MKTFIFLVVTLFVLSSCKKKQKPIVIEEPTGTFYADYARLKVGNYWIYERYKLDTTGNAIALGIYDTCFVEKDTIINEKRYFKYVRPLYGSSALSTAYLRDSADCIVTDQGRIVFSSQVFNHVFRTFQDPSGWYELQEWMVDKDLNITVPAGTYTTRNFQQIFNMAENFQQFGDKRYTNTRYAVNIGIISETLPLYISTPDIMERRLREYHVE